MAPRFRATFQTTFFLSAVSAALIALAVAGAIFATTMRRQLDARIEQTLVAETRLAADLLSHGTPVATLPALGRARVGGVAIAWLFSARISRRVRLIAGIAERYTRGDLSPPHLGYGDDELGTVARALDDSVQEIGRQLTQQARDRARMEAILAGMIEGVIVVDSQARLQLVNAAARQMLKLDEVAIGRPYVETIRLPVIAEIVASVLFGRTPARRRSS